MSTNLYRQALLASVGTLAFAVSYAGSSASAQTVASPPGTAKADTAPVGLAEVVVTAQRRSENLQKVPLSVQALTAATLQRGDVQDISRIELVSPGVTFAYGGNDAKINMRGNNANNTFQDASPIVGVFIDGVYTARASETSNAFFDINQIEILKGPQGTLYGRNTLSGAININTAAPSLARESLSLISTYSSYNDYREEAAINVPLTDNFAIRAAGFYERSDGYFKNSAGPNLGAKDNLGVRGSAYWHVNDAVNAILRVTEVRNAGTAPAVFGNNGQCRAVDANGLTDLLGTFTDCQNPRRGSGGTAAFNSRGPLDLAEDFVPKERLTDFNATLEINADLGFAKLKSISSYTNYKSLIGQDSDFSPNPYEREWFEENAKSYTQEVQVSNASQSKIRYTVGGYFSRDEEFFADTKIFQTVDVNNRPLVTVPTSAGGTATLPVQNGTPLASLNTCINCAGATFPATPGKLYQAVNVNTFGAFAQTTYSPTARLRLTLGARYSREDKDEVFNQVAAPYIGVPSPTIIPGPDAFPTSSVPAVTYSQSFDRWTYRAGADYDVTDQVMAYFTFSTGFLSGALNPFAVGGLKSTGEQGSISYEAGVKSRFLDNRVQLNADIFETDYSNLITTVLVNGTTTNVNGGAINAKGAEAILDWAPVDPLHITVGVSYVDSKFGDYGKTNPVQVYNGIRLQPNTPGAIIQEQGLTAPFAPRWSGNVGASYVISLGAVGTLTPQLQFFFTSKYSAAGGLVFDPAAQQAAYTKTDLRLVYATLNGRYSVEAYVENLENVIVNQRTQSGTDGIEQVSWGPPRMFGGRLRVKF
jgi:iron complex outermembrane receptor protein